MRRAFLSRADQIGLPRILDRVRVYAQQVGSQYWTPAPRLVELAAKNAGFYTS